MDVEVAGKDLAFAGWRKEAAGIRGVTGGNVDAELFCRLIAA